ncbi:MAG TPA: TRAP transporter large permease [Thermodesulfobacteriota bacterium]
MSLLVLLLAFGVFLAARAQIAFALGLASLVYLFLFMPTVSPETIPQQMYAGADSFALTAIPFFVLVGELMNTGGISRRLVTFSHTLVGHLAGGMGVVELLASMIFASFSGSAVANAAGTGAITIPAMKRSGYPSGMAAAIESSSSSLGAIIPPSIPMVVYGSIAGVSVGALFVGGYVPGIVMGLGLAVVIGIVARRRGLPVGRRATAREVLAAARDAGPALLTPVLIMGGILGGIMTPTEAGAVGAVYAFLVARFVHREISLRDLPRVLLATACTTGVVMLVMTIATLFGWILAFEQVPTRMAEALLGGIRNPAVLTVGVVLFLLAVGTFIETIPALIILTPVLAPMAQAAGIDPVFFGVIVCIALTLGVVTPPVGVVLFVTSSIAKATLEETSRAIVPFLAVLIGGTLAFALMPQAVTWLPRLLGY